jgi:hypothetical protein
MDYPELVSLYPISIDGPEPDQKFNSSVIDYTGPAGTYQLVNVTVYGAESN